MQLYSALSHEYPRNRGSKGIKRNDHNLRVPNARPACVQSFANALCELLLASSAPDMASFVAGQVYSKLHRIGMLRDDEGSGQPAWLRGALELARDGDQKFTRIVEALAVLSPSLIWTKRLSGPFASANYAIGNGNAMIIGPGGLEDRDDVQLSLVLTGPYCRSPDQTASRRQIFLFLSSSEFSTEERAWKVVTPGSIIVVESGSDFAMRCTRDPLLAIQCQIDDVRR